MLMQVKEEEEYLEWLKGQKQTLSKDKSIAAELVSLASFSSMAFSCCCPKKDGMLKSMCCCNFLAGSFIFFANSLQTSLLLLLNCFYKY